MRLFDEWRLLPQRIALHEASATAVIADVHLGYSAARQRLGDAIPWRSVAEEMRPLAEAIKTNDIRNLIVAGDLFENGFDADILAQVLQVLDQLHITFTGIVPGNHDRGIEKSAVPLPLFPDGYDLAGWRIVHGDQANANAQAIMGHWHPAIRHKRRKVPCFLVRGMQMVLPAFSLDAAGGNVRSDSRWRDWDCYAIDGNEAVRALEEK
jgi:metallophosphoesterase superfamily enzyme